MAQQTAIEWLEMQYHRKDYTLSSNDFQQAKQIEKEQSIAELRHKDGTPMRKYNSPKLQEIEMGNELEEAAERLYPEEWDWKEREIFIEGAKWYREQLKKR